MSSLIDRQAAIEVVSKECFELRGIFGLIEDGLNELPTVEAIPIEWLRMWFTKKASLIGIVLISEIESDWEKENETNVKC